MLCGGASKQRVAGYVKAIGLPLPPFLLKTKSINTHTMTTDQKLKSIAELLIATQKNNLIVIDINECSSQMNDSLNAQDIERATYYREKLVEARTKLFTREQLESNILILENILK